LRPNIHDLNKAADFVKFKPKANLYKIANGKWEEFALYQIIGVAYIAQETGFKTTLFDDLNYSNLWDKDTGNIKKEFEDAFGVETAKTLLSIWENRFFKRNKIKLKLIEDKELEFNYTPKRWKHG